MTILEVTIQDLGVDEKLTPKDMVNKIFNHLNIEGYKLEEFRGYAIDYVSEFGVYCVSSEGVFVVDLSFDNRECDKFCVKVSLANGVFIGSLLHDPVKMFVVKIGYE